MSHIVPGESETSLSEQSESNMRGCQSNDVSNSLKPGAIASESGGSRGIASSRWIGSSSKVSAYVSKGLLGTDVLCSPTDLQSRPAPTSKVPVFGHRDIRSFSGASASSAIPEVPLHSTASNFATQFSVSGVNVGRTVEPRTDEVISNSIMQALDSEQQSHPNVADVSEPSVPVRASFAKKRSRKK